MIGSGQLGTPRERMHWLNRTILPNSCADAAGVLWPPFGSSCTQARSATWNCELLTPSCWTLTLISPFGNSLPRLGSG
jgi:hypothetical protein